MSAHSIGRRRRLLSITQQREHYIRQFSALLFLIAVALSIKDDGEESKERHCDSLIMCIVTTLNEGMRNGGGIGDVLRKPSSKVC